MTELENFECVSYIMTITPLLNNDWEKMGVMGIVLIFDDAVYVCICTVYSSVFKEVTQHTFIYDSHFSAKKNSEYCGEIIDIRAYSPIYVLDEKYRKRKSAMRSMLR